MGAFAQGALIENSTSTATSGGTLTLTVSSETVQRLTGTADHTVVLPDATTLKVGRAFVVVNESTGVVYVNFNGGSKAAVLAGKGVRELRLVAAGSAAGTWAITTPVDHYSPLKLTERPTPDSKLLILANRVRQNDGTQLSTTVLEDAFNSFVETTIDFQSGAIAGGTVHTDGSTFALPASVTGEYRRMALVYDSANNKVNTSFSASVSSLGSLAAPETLFQTLDGVALGYIDLEGTASSTPGAYKSPGASTSIILNHVGTTVSIHRFASSGGGSGGGSNLFKLASLTGDNLTLKGGSSKEGMVLSDGTELMSYDGSGTATTDFGKDLTINLDTVLGSTPADSTTYYLYIDLNNVGSATIDNGRLVRTVTTSSFALFAAGTEVNRARYVRLGLIRSASSGNAWTGTGASFATIGQRFYDNGPLAVTPVVYRLPQQAVGSVGSANQIVAGHILSSKTFAGLTASTVSWWNLAANANDGSTNGRNLTNNNTVPFTGTNIHGTTNAAANLTDGSSHNFSSTDAHFNPGNSKSFALGGWVAFADWTPATEEPLASNYISGTDVGFAIVLGTDGRVTFYATNTSNVDDFILQGPVTGFTDGTFHHIVGVFDHANQTMKLFYDGKLVASRDATNQRSLTSSVFRIGRYSTNIYSTGRFQDFFFHNSGASSGALTDEQVRRIYAYRIDHSAAVASAKQRWSASIVTTITDRSEGWLVDQSDTDSVFVDFSSLASTDQVELTLEHMGLNAVIVPARAGFDQTYTVDPTFPIAHGQGEVPELLIMGLNTATSDWETIPTTGHIAADSTEITGSLATLLNNGYSSVRVKARAGQNPTGVSQATKASPGIVTSYAPTIASSVLAASADATISDGDGYDTVLVTTGATSRTITLPTAADNAGRKLFIKKVDSGVGTVTVEGEGAETIDDSANYVITSQYAFVTLVCNGTGWFIIG
jgi:hypothetical protein